MTEFWLCPLLAAVFGIIEIRGELCGKIENHFRVTSMAPVRTAKEEENIQSSRIFEDACWTSHSQRSSSGTS